MFTAFNRVIKSGFIGFWRSGWLSLATIFMLMLTLFVLAGLGFMVRSADYLLMTLQEKVDVSVYFKPEVEEGRMLRVKEQLLLVNGVKDIEYVSRDEALARFRDQHSQNEVIMQSLEELGENPLEASLNIRAHEAAQFDAIAAFLENKNYENDIDKVSYTQNRDAIQKLAAITRAVRKGGLVVVAVLAAIAILVSFNTIRLAIYAMREEIGVMRLVGASNWFIRGPFFIESILYAVIASALTLGIWWPILQKYSPAFDRILPGLHLFSYFTSNMLLFAGGMVGVAILLSVVSSAIAIGRYLKV
ncbi:MAG: permease-like cell division protein FtsX [bacterium]|nr:permease-like cell division protein FtsX [bacterium]